MNKKEITGALSRASKEEIKSLVEPITDTYKIEIMKAPQKGLVMVKVRESIKQSLFYLGEVLVTECMVMVNGIKGVSVMAGDDFEKVLNSAIIDAILNGDFPESLTILNQLKELDQKQQKERGIRNSQILKSKVNFNIMGE